MDYQISNKHLSKVPLTKANSAKCISHPSHQTFTDCFRGVRSANKVDRTWRVFDMQCLYLFIPGGGSRLFHSSIMDYPTQGHAGPEPIPDDIGREAGLHPAVQLSTGP